MLEINGVYNFIKIEIRDYIKKEIRKKKKLDEDDCWCRLHIYLKNEYLEIDVNDILKNKVTMSEVELMNIDQLIDYLYLN